MATSQFVPEQDEDRSNDVYWYNQDGETCPPFGLVQVSGYNVDLFYYTGKRSTTYGSLWFANGPTPVASGSYGEGYFLDNTAMCQIAVPGGYGNLFPGYSAGPVPGTWVAGPGSEFRVVTARPELLGTDYQSAAGAAALMLADAGRRRGILQGNLGATVYDDATPYRLKIPQVANMAMLYVKPDRSFDYQYDLGGAVRTVPVSNPFRNISFASGTYVHAVYFDRHWEVVAADCADELPEE